MNDTTNCRGLHYPMHAIVIGAGPAGSLAALLLKRGGCEVTLIERHRFPRHKVCGECLSAFGREVLRRHGLDGLLENIGVELVRTQLHAGGETVQIDLPQPMLGISRAVLDLKLLDAAVSEGVNLLQPARVLAVVTLPLEGGGRGRGGGVERQEYAESARRRDVSPGSAAHAAASLSADPKEWADQESRPPDSAPYPLPQGEGEKIAVRWASADSAIAQLLQADVVVLANGAATFTGDKPAPTGDLGIKTHFRRVRADPGAITLYAADGCYGGAAPIEDRRWNAAFSVPAERVKTAGGDVAAVFDSLLSADPAMAKAFTGAERIEPWLASPLPRYSPCRDWPANVVPVGNAAAAIEPIGGEGMGLALRSAELAVGAILSGQLDSLHSQYKRLWQTRSMGCRLAALAMTQGRATAWALGLLNVPTLAEAGMRLIGKA